MQIIIKNEYYTFSLNNKVVHNPSLKNIKKNQTFFLKIIFLKTN